MALAPLVEALQGWGYSSQASPSLDWALSVPSVAGFLRHVVSALPGSSERRFGIDGPLDVLSQEEFDAFQEIVSKHPELISEHQPREEGAKLPDDEPPGSLPPGFPLAGKIEALEFQLKGLQQQLLKQRESAEKLSLLAKASKARLKNAEKSVTSKLHQLGASLDRLNEATNTWQTVLARTSPPLIHNDNDTVLPVSGDDKALAFVEEMESEIRRLTFLFALTAQSHHEAECQVIAAQSQLDSLNEALSHAPAGSSSHISLQPAGAESAATTAETADRISFLEREIARLEIESAVYPVDYAAKMAKQERRMTALKKLDTAMTRSLAVHALAAHVATVRKDSIVEAYRTVTAVQQEMQSDYAGAQKRQTLLVESDSIVPDHVLLDETDPFIRELFAALDPHQDQSPSATSITATAQRPSHETTSSLRSAESMVRMARDLVVRSADRGGVKAVKPWEQSELAVQDAARLVLAQSVTQEICLDSSDHSKLFIALKNAVESVQKAMRELR
ncbi:hypothetical protein M427DRAFT_340676 [Gonapodya prolifera JEL478]|uniref:Uncharacterized protein n=1 Tax=Gonapodya prolifera (strain JEL478) TaxID=1344416 RepID=A0A139ACA1_GONPJ|nr:hypothetical protein M427DRAFT_340676 [Gonapodya prolifera JEL478]|eukprot:KXS14368.1 hypothetical protein M427DRAFT_340676 [Gonapodya prolifera JEL478]